MQPTLPYIEETAPPADCHDLPDRWRYVKLGTVAAVSSGGTPSRTVQRYWGGTIPWLTTSAINFNVITEPSELITEEGLQQSSAKVFPPRTVLMAMYGQGATRGRVALLGIETAINQACAAIQPSGDVHPEYLFYTLMSRYDEIREVGHGGNQRNLNAHLIRSIRLCLPQIDEQTRIVEILDAADASVRAIESLIEAKLRYKRALAEQLLTGKRRFPEFQGQVWHGLPIGGFAKHRNERNSQANEHPVFSCTKHRGLVYSLEYFGKRIHSENLSDYKIVRRGDFAYATNHIEEGSIGLQELCAVGLVSPMYTVFEIDGTQAATRFLFALLKTEAYRQRFASLTSASVNRRGSVRWPSFAKIRIELPPLAEQNKMILSIFRCCHAAGQTGRLKPQQQQHKVGLRRLNAGIATQSLEIETTALHTVVGEGRLRAVVARGFNRRVEPDVIPDSDSNERWTGTTKSRKC